jgi:hypothetical protein
VEWSRVVSIDIRYTMSCEFVDWLTHTLRRDMQVENAAHTADTIYQYLRQYRTTADLLLARDTLLDMMADTMACAMHQQETFTDELINRYHMAEIAQEYTNVDAMDCEEAQTDSGVCPSPEYDKPVNYDSAFPPLHVGHVNSSTHPIDVPQGEHMTYNNDDSFDTTTQYYLPPTVNAESRSDGGSFDGTHPRFVMPRSLMTSLPMPRGGVGQGFYPTNMTQIQRLMQSTSRRVRNSSVSDMIPPFCVPRVECQAMSLPHEPPSHLVPVNGRTHFAPIRSDSMSWAYCDEGTACIAPDSGKRAYHQPNQHAPMPVMLTANLHDAIQLSTDRYYSNAIEPHIKDTSWDAHLERTSEDEKEWHRVWQQQDEDVPLTFNASAKHPIASNDADDWLEDEKLLSFVGGIAVTSPLQDED